ncbi:DNA topoisomerase IV subunit B [Flavobacteriales bacterium ALC-1]|nr:DNA topoisomerase IV subunit B [Flavobacteriales bacterium ALC-1]
MKNNLTLILILLFALNACKNNTEFKNEVALFTLEASLTNVPDSTLFYLKPISNITLDSAYVVNGHLSMKGQLKSQRPELLTLFTSSPEFIYTQLFVENENVTFVADKKDFPWNIDMSGSIYQDDTEKFNQIMYQKQKLENELAAMYSSDEKLLSKKVSEVKDSLDGITIELIKENFNSYAALRKFLHYKTKFSSEELSHLYDKLDDELKQTKEGIAIKLQSEFSNPKVGDKYYDYKAINQHGDNFAISDVKNKYILLHFSSFACYGSQLSLPELKSIYEDYTDDIEIVSISTDVNEELWHNHVVRDSIPWHYLWDGKGDYNEAYVKYWEVGTPNFVLISPDKIILERWFGYAKGMIDEKLSKYMN